MIDGFGLRLPGQLPTNPAKRSEFSIRMLTVLDLSLAIVQLVQVIQLLCVCISIESL
jgi:hypothetical protein